MVRPVEQLFEDRFEAYTRLLITTLWLGGYPHEILCYLLVNIIERPFGPMQDRTSGGGTWTPAEIISELSNVPLRTVCADVREDYQLSTDLDAEIVQSWFLRIELDMNRRVHHIIKSKDQSACKRWIKILDRLVGSTTLRHYLSDETEHRPQQIRGWVHRVSRNIQTFLVKEGWKNVPLGRFCEEVKQRWIEDVVSDTYHSRPHSPLHT